MEPTRSAIQPSVLFCPTLSALSLSRPLVCRLRSCHMGRLHVIAVDEILEFGMKEVGPELVLLHFRERLVGRPTLVGHAIDRGHQARAMPAALAVHVYRLVRRILDQIQ